MGMLPLALFLKKGGALVEGWDDALSPRVEKILCDGGVSLRNPAFDPPECDFLVYSSAVKPDHPAFRSASGSKPERYRRGELLAEIARGRRLLAVAGSHGKTTTTAMIAWAARCAGFPMDHLIGGLPDGGLAPSSNEGAQWLVAEIDESDGTIEGFHPEVTLFVNFDWDHADRYATRREMCGAWERLAGRTTGVVCHPAGEDGGIAWPEEVRRMSFPVSSRDDFRESDSAAALAALSEASGRSLSPTLLKDFPGVWRRQSVHLREPGVAVLEDYAHHPAEVSGLLSWIRRESFPEPLRVYFQPHRFSRTTRFAEEFVHALKGLDFVGLHSIYGAGENAEGDPLERIREGLEREGVRVDRIAKLNDFQGFGSFERPRGTYAFVGAGDANDWAPVLAARYLAETPAEALCRLAGERLGEGAVERNAGIGPLTTLRVGGRAALLARPDSEASLRWLLRTASLLEVPVAFMGNGSNLLVADEGFDGLVIHFEGPPWEERRLLPRGDRFLVAAGVSLPSLARWAASHGLSGFEFMEGIPGTVGGGLRMNAGSMGGWMQDVVERVEGIDSRGRLISFAADELDFGYRSCPRLDSVCIIRAVFVSPEKKDPEAIRKTMREFATRRRESQPGGASAGCLFRNPDGDSAGRLIEAAGLKGHRVGGVRISEKHANFVLPDRTARSADIVALMDGVRSAVRERFAVTLQPEVRFLGPGARGCWNGPDPSEGGDA